MARRIKIAILAAGRSNRFGGAKLLVPWNGKLLLHRSLEAASASCPNNVYLIAGHRSAELCAAAAKFPCQVIVNDRFAEGMGTSVACAITACRDSTDAVIVMLADQPLVTTDHLQEIIDTWNGGEHHIVATGFLETVGPPVLFSRGYFDQLEALSGDTGAKGVVKRNLQSVTTVNFEPASIDIDTSADLAALDV